MYDVLIFSIMRGVEQKIIAIRSIAFLKFTFLKVFFFSMNDYQIVGYLVQEGEGVYGVFRILYLWCNSSMRDLQSLAQ